MKVIFSTGPQLGSRLLRLALASEWSHCGIVMPDGSVIEASSKHGVVRTPLLKFTRYGQWAVQDCPVPDAAACYDAAERQLGKGYDWLGLLGLAAIRNWQDDDSWFCSELVQYCKLQGGLADLRFEHWRVTPRDLWGLPYRIVARA